MIIGIDARMLGKGYGLGRYVEQLLIQLDTLEHEYTFVLFVREETKELFTPTSDRFRTVIADIPWYSVQEQTAFLRIIREAQVDLMHFPHFNVPLWYRDPFLVTIHDLTMFHFPRPEATTRSRAVFWIKDRAHRWIIRSAVRRATHIITPSEYVRHDVHQTLGVPLEKMTTVYQAPFDRIQNTQSTIHAPQNTSLRGSPVGGDAAISFGMQPYVLYVGAAYPHKNIEGLLDAWERYVDTYGGTEELLLVGKENYFWNRLKPRIAALPHVRYLGFQTDEQLEACYAHARAFVFPSLSEGFGIPPLEAMRYGIPVLSSSASCLPEVLGEGALYTDTTNPEMFADSIHMILHDADVRHQLLIQSKAVLAQYSSERFGRETLQIYRACCE